MFKLIFAYNPLESSSRQSCVTPSTIWREAPCELSTLTRSTENKIHSPSPLEEPSIKQMGDSRLNISPPL